MASNTLQVYITAKNLASEAFKQAGNDIKAIDSQMQQNLTTARNWAAAFATAGAVISGLAVKTFAEFEQEMSNVAAITQTTGKDLENLSMLAREMGAETVFSASEAAQGMKFLGQAGFDTNEIMDSLASTMNLAAASGIDLGRAADIASNVLTGFRLEAVEAERVVDVLAKTVSSSNVNMEQLSEAMKFFAPTAASLGVSVEEASATVGLLGNAGLQGSIATRALATSLTNLASPTSEMQAVMSQLNLEFFNAQGEFIGIQALIGELSTGFEGLTQQQQQAALSTLFGAEAIKQFSILLDVGEEGLAKFTEELMNAQGTAQEMAETQMNNLKGSIEELSGATDEAAILFGGFFAPAIRAVIDFATGLIRKFTELSPWIQNTVFIVGGLLIAFTGLAAIIAAVTLASGTLAAAFGTLTGVLGATATAIGAATVAASSFLIPLGLLAAAFGTIFAVQQMYINGLQEQAAQTVKASEAAQAQADIYSQVADSIIGDEREIFEYKAQVAAQTAEINRKQSELQILLAEKSSVKNKLFDNEALDSKIKTTQESIKNLQKESDAYASANKDRIFDLAKTSKKLLVTQDKLSEASVNLSKKEFSNRINLATQYAEGNVDLQELILRATGNISKKEVEIIVQRYNASLRAATQAQNALVDLFSTPIYQVIEVILPKGLEGKFADAFQAKAMQQAVKKAVSEINVDFSDIGGGGGGGGFGGGGGGGGSIADSAADLSKKLEESFNDAKQSFEDLNIEAGESLRELRQTHDENLQAMEDSIMELEGSLAGLQDAFNLDIAGLGANVADQVVKQEELIQSIRDSIAETQEQIKEQGESDGSADQLANLEEKLAQLTAQLNAESSALEGFLSAPNSVLDQQAQLVEDLKKQLESVGADTSIEDKLRREQAVLDALGQDSGTFEDQLAEARQKAALTDFERFIADADARKLRLAQDFADRTILLQDEILAIQEQKDAEIAAFNEKIVKYGEAADAFTELQNTFEAGLESMAGQAESKVTAINEAIASLQQALSTLAGSGGEGLTLDQQLAALQQSVPVGGAGGATNAGGNSGDINVTISGVNINNTTDLDNFNNKVTNAVAEGVKLSNQGSQ